MSQIKTAISIDQVIFETVNLLAKRAHISRSRFFEIAVREWLRKDRAKNITARIDQALGKIRTSSDEVRQAEFGRSQQRKLMEGEW